MAIKITNDCINCGACEPECPNGAIYADGDNWKIADKTEVHGAYTLMDGTTVDADSSQVPYSTDTYYIVTDKCTECKVVHDTPQCASVCPVDCCLADELHVETEEALLAKKAKLHLA